MVLIYKLEITFWDYYPKRYRGYYYDSETGLYYLKSRYYDPEVGRFISVDSKLNTTLGVLGLNVFTYCLNNPSNKVDYSGEKPGDLFDTKDEAAKDFGNYINGKSISDNREYVSVIFPIVTTQTNYIQVPRTFKFLWRTFTWTEEKPITLLVVKYTYSEPIRGGSDGAEVPDAPKGYNSSAFVHTHAAYDPNYFNDVFSPNDKAIANDLKMPIYVVTPLGTLRKYDPATGDDVILFYDMPYDPKHPNRER